ncbi:chondroitin AC/alginate lyase [Dendrothele bispora CBS 962.96]|uniref:Chondroitin AC/alginate lyase n=1 Tax=Dendrothele bispora (strain CBS 962.96) TaxID=1314807 RepID=A0A4V4HEN0_DENBC|nr:chondroitin AC/alginate lyase [Dendrothele bispora CBS 962.96]
MIPEAEAQAPFVEQPLITTIPTGAVSTPGDKTIISSSPTATDAASGSSGPQAAIKTKQPEHTCTPSPTKSTAPSATWTTCPYETRDGKVNPDTRSLSGPGTINTISQDVLYNAIAYALSKKAAYAQTVSKLTDVLFRNADTYLNPNVNFGQVVRGPGQNMGTFTGILDFRGMVKIINGLQILKVAGYSATKESSDGLQRWFQQYGKWLDTNTLSKKAGTRPNNHGTFFALQHAAVKMALGDYSGAKQVIQKFFDEIFPDQIAQSGEQPFEAVRTRPFHYRCFNLEALIALCKIADALGMECWNKKSKYGTGIQDAIDFTMKQIPKNENAAELVPHLAAAAAVFGDPLGKYATYMQKVQSNYKQRPFWYYDQPGALNFGTGSGKAKRGDTSPTVLFDCPRIFEIEGGEVEIEDGLFVTCAELQPFFELPSSTD